MNIGCRSQTLAISPCPVKRFARRPCARAGVCADLHAVDAQRGRKVPGGVAEAERLETATPSPVAYGKVLYTHGTGSIIATRG